MFVCCRRTLLFLSLDAGGFFKALQSDLHDNLLWLYGNQTVFTPAPDALHFHLSAHRPPDNSHRKARRTIHAMEMLWLYQDQMLRELARHHHVLDRLVRDDHDFFPRAQFTDAPRCLPSAHARTQTPSTGLRHPSFNHCCI